MACGALLSHRTPASIDCSTLTTCDRCATRLAHCRFCGSKCIAASVPCPALPNVMFGEREKCTERVTVGCPVSQACGDCTQWPMCQYCEGSGCIDQTRSCPGGIAVASGGKCPIRITYDESAALPNATLVASSTASVVVVLGARLVDKMSPNLAGLTGAVDAARVTVDARRLDVLNGDMVALNGDVVVPLFSALNGTVSLANVSAVRVVVPDCLEANNATLAAADKVIIAIFRVTGRMTCVATTAASQPATTSGFAPNPSTPSGSNSPDTSSGNPSSGTSSASSQTASASGSQMATASTSGSQMATASTNGSQMVTTALSLTTSLVAAPLAPEGAAWIVPVAASAGVVVALLAVVGVAVLMWKRRQQASAAQRGVEMTTARADDDCTSNYGVLPVRPEGHYVERVSDFKVIAPASSHYDQLTATEAAPSTTDTLTGAAANTFITAQETAYDDLDAQS